MKPQAARLSVNGVQMLTSPILEFESRIRACLPGLLRYLAMLGCEAARAEDLAQEALLQLWRKGLTEMDDRATAAWCKGRLKSAAVGGRIVQHL